jgi:hypothetical protein
MKKLLKSLFNANRRKSKRHKVDAHCLAVRLDQQISVPVSIVDISMTGMGFVVRQAYFKVGDNIELQFSSIGAEARVIRGSIVFQSILKNDSSTSSANTLYRFSVEFDHSITEKYFSLLNDVFADEIEITEKLARQV